MVLHLQRGRALLAPHAQLHRPGAVLEGIVEQIHHHLLQPARVPVAHIRLGLMAELHPRLLGLALQARRRLADQLRKVHRLQLHAQAPRVDAGDVQQVVHQIRHLPHLTEPHPQVPPLPQRGLGLLAAGQLPHEQLKLQLQRRQGRLQLVARHLEEFVPQLHRFPQRALRALDVRHVHHQRHVAAHLALRVPVRHAQGGEIPRLGPLPQPGHGSHRLALEHRGHRGQRLLGGMEAAQPGRPVGIRRVAGHVVGEGPVLEQRPAVPVHVQDHGRERVDDQPQLRLAALPRSSAS